MSVVGGPRISLNGVQSYFMPAHRDCYTGAPFLNDLITPNAISYVLNSPTFNGTGLIFNSGSVTGQCWQLYTAPTTGMFSFEIVVKRIPGSTYSQQLINTSLYYTGGTSYEVFYDDTRLLFNANKFNQVANSFSNNFAQNKYTHYYMVFNTGIQKLYANGQLVGSGNYFNTGTRDIAKNYTLCHIANPVGPPPVVGNTATYGTEAEIALVRTYTRELTYDEVINNFNATRSYFNI